MDNPFVDVPSAAKYLDEQFPGWHKRINIDVLYQGNEHRCVLGQIFRDEAKRAGYEHSPYEYALNQLGITYQTVFGSYSTSEWKEEVRERQARDSTMENVATIRSHSALKLATMESELRAKLAKIDTLKKLVGELHGYNDMLKQTRKNIEVTQTAIGNIHKELGLE